MPKYPGNRMWKYEPEDPNDKSHLKGKQFKSAITMDHEFDNDGNPIFSEPKETKAEYGKRIAMNKRALKDEHKF